MTRAAWVGLGLVGACIGVGLVVRAMMSRPEALCDAAVSHNPPMGDPIPPGKQWTCAGSSVNDCMDDRAKSAPACRSLFDDWLRCVASADTCKQCDRQLNRWSDCDTSPSATQWSTEHPYGAR